MDQLKELEKYKELFDQGAISEDEFRKLKQKTLGLKSDEEKEAEKLQEREAALAEIEKMRAEEKARKDEEERAEQNRVRAEQEKIQQQKIDEERLKQVEIDKERQFAAQKAYEEEKARERARLEALHEQENKQRIEQKAKAQQAAKKATGVVAKVILWIVAVFCALVGIFSFVPSKSVSMAFSIVSGVFFIMWAVMACPPITKKLRENEKLDSNWKYKKFIVIATVIIWFVLAAILA